MSIGTKRKAVLSWAVGIATAGLTVGIARAATNYTWDPSMNTTGSDGAGFWDTTSNFWANGGTDSMWPNTGNETAIFGSGGTADVVTLNANITAAGLTFNSGITGNYTIAANSGDSLTFNGFTPTISVASGLNTVISAPLVAATGQLQITNGGQLTLSGSNTGLTGGLEAIGSQINFSTDNNLGQSNGPLTLLSATLNYTSAAAITQSRSLSLSGAGGTINIANAAAVDTFNGPITGSAPLTVTGSGQLILGSTSNSFSSLTINGAAVSFSADTNLGAAGGAVNISNGGAIINTFNGGQISLTRVFTFGTGGGTISEPMSGAGQNKLFFGNAANQITGSGLITKTGPGWLQINQAENNSGGWTISGGVIEAQNPTAMGTAGVTINTGGELAVTGQTITNAITLNGGTLGADGNGTNYSGGGVIVNSPSTLRLGDFWESTNRSFTISSNLSGSGNLSLANGNLNVPIQPTSQVLTLSGSNAGYSGSLNLDGGHVVAFSNANALVKVATTSSAYAIPVVTMGYNFGLAGTINGGVPNVVSSTNAGTGVSGILNIGIQFSGENINLATLYDGQWGLGSTGNNSFFGAITAPTTGIYRLGGGGGAIFIGNTSTLSGATTVVVGDPRIGGNGEVRYGNTQNYSGGNTTVNPTGWLDMDFNPASTPLTNLMPTGSKLTLNGGQFSMTGKASVSNSQVVSGLFLTAGASTIVMSPNATSNPLLLTLGAINHTVGATLDVTLSGTSSTTNGVTTTTGNSAGTILGGWATVGGNSWAVATSNGTNNNITSLATYTTTTSGGNTASNYSSKDVDVTTSPTLNAAATPNSLRFNTNATDTLTLTGTNVVASGGILVTNTVAAHNSIITGGNLTSGSGELIIIDNDATTANTLTTTSAITNNGATPVTVTKSGVGTWLINNADTFSGGLIINAGTVTFGGDSGLGAAGKSVTLNGGTFNYTGTGQITYSGSNARTFNINAPVTFSNAGKIFFNAGAGQITGSGALIKAGTAQLDLNQDNTGFTGAMVVTAGTLSADTANAAGVNGGNVIVYGGEFAIGNENPGTGVSNAVNVTLAGGTISGVNSTGTAGSNFTGPITVTGAAQIRLGDFWENVSRNLTISGNITGGGPLTLINAFGASAPTGQSLFLSGNNSGYYGIITSDGGHNVVFNATNSIPTHVVVSSSSAGLGGIGINYDPNSSPAAANTGLPTFTDSTTTFGGVLGINAINNNTPINESTLYNSGLWFLGSQSSGTYALSSLTPGLDSNGNSTIYRLGGGSGTLTITNSILSDFNSQPTSVLIGANTPNGGGTVVVSSSNSYSGGTTINGGNLNFAGLVDLGSGNITFGGGALQYATGNIDDISVRTVTLATGGGTIDTGGNNVAFANSIGNGGVGSFSKAGSGTLTLTASNNYSGATNFNGGVVNFSNLNNFGSGNAITFGGGTVQWATGNTADISTTTAAGVRTIALNAGGGTMDTNGNNVTIANAMTGAGGLTKAGTGTLTLSGANAFTGGLTVNAGTVSYGSGANAATNLGPAGGAVSVNGGTVSYSGTVNLTETHIFTFGTAGGTLDLANFGNGGGGSKLIFGNANQFLGGNTAGAITVTGQGIITLQSNATTYSGAGWIINGSVIEDGKVGALGATSVPVTINPGGELSGKGITIANPITISGGILGVDSATATAFSGPLTVTPSTSSQIQLGNFFGGSANHPLTISGNITGSGSLSLMSAYATVAPLVLAAPTGQVLTLTGSNAGYTGALTMPGFYEVRFVQTSNPTAAANSVVQNISFAAPTDLATVGLPVVLYDSGDAGNSFAAVAPPTITDTTGNSGIFAYNGTAYEAGQVVNLAPLANGEVFFGTTTGGTFAGTFDPNTTTDNTIRLTGGGSTLNILQTNAITDPTSGHTSLLVGAVASNGGGTVVLQAPQNYGGGTTIANGTLMLGNSVANATVGNLPSGTVVTFGTATTNGALDLGGNNTTVGGLAVASGATSASQIIGNSSTTSGSVLTVDTTAGSSTFAGVIKDALGAGTQTTALNVQGTHSLILQGVNTYTGNTTVNTGTLEISSPGSIASTNISVVGTATLTVDSGGNITSTPNVTDNGTVNFNNPSRTISTLNGSGAMNLNGTTLTVNNGGTFSGAIANGASSGSLTVAGGTMSLSGVNTYSGNTVITGGTLAITGAGSIANSTHINLNGGSLDVSGVTAPPFVVGSAQTLMGQGAVVGAVTVNGTLATGQTINNAAKTSAVTLTLGTGSTLAGSTLEDIVAANSSDKVIFGNGTDTGGGALANFGGTLTVTSPNTPASFSFAAGQSYDLFDFGSETGAFSSVSLPTLSGGLTWNTSALYTSGIISIGGGGPANLFFTGGNGAWDIAATANFTDGSNPLVFHTGDNVTFDNTHNTGPFTVSVASGGVVPGVMTVTGNTPYTFSGGKIGSGSSTSLTVASGSSMTFDRGLGSRVTLELGSLSNSGTINLKDNHLLIHNADQATADATTAAIFTQLHNGFAGGTWTGGTNPSILSSVAAGSTLYTLGEVESGTDVKVNYAYYGDANLDGMVDGTDYSLIDTGFGGAGTGWQNGDFNYDGHVDGSDYSLIDNAFNTQTGSAPAAQLAINTSEIAGGSAAVPEPASLGLLAIGAIGLMARRRRRGMKEQTPVRPA